MAFQLHWNHHILSIDISVMLSLFLLIYIMHLVALYISMIIWAECFW